MKKNKKSSKNQREEIRTTAAGSSLTQLRVTETWTQDAADALCRGRSKMRQGIDGVQQCYEYGRSVGYTYAKDGAVQQTVFTGYGTDGRIATAGMVHGGSQKVFSYAYQMGTGSGRECGDLLYVLPAF